jgi:hypothetical protein
VHHPHGALEHFYFASYVNRESLYISSMSFGKRIILALEFQDFCKRGIINIWLMYIRLHVILFRSLYHFATCCTVHLVCHHPSYADVHGTLFPALSTPYLRDIVFVGLRL